MPSTFIKRWMLVLLQEFKTCIPTYSWCWRKLVEIFVGGDGHSLPMLPVANPLPNNTTLPCSPITTIAFKIYKKIF